MPAVATGSSLGARSVVLDLTNAGALVVRDATKEEYSKVTSVDVHGTTGGGDGTIVMRFDSASGRPFFVFGTANTTRYDVDNVFGEALGARIGKGLYVDALNTAWAAGATCTIHFA